MAATWALEKVPTSAWDFLLWSNSWEVGTAAACQVDGSVTRMRWYRRTTNVGDVPVAMHLWDVETEAVLHTVDPIPDNGTVGWQVYTVDPPVNVSAGQVVIAAYEVAYGKTLAYSPVGLLWAPPSFPAGLATPIYWSTAAPSPGFPDTSSNDYVAGIDLEFSGFLPSGSWEKVAETTYDGTLKWVQPADKYRLNVTTIVQWKQAQTVEGEDIRRVIGAWWPYVDGFKGQRFLIDAPKSELAQPNGRRMDGLLLDTGSGSAGTVEAWILS
jgi:hypothetical protein